MNRTRHTPTIPLLVLLLLALSTGCKGGMATRGSATIEQWQKQVETFIEVNGHGDPSVLRNAGKNSNPGTITILGGESSVESTDVTGLLLGVGPNTPGAEVKSEILFLVAVIENNKVSDIRPVTLTVSLSDGRLAWSIAPANSGALKTYTTAHSSTTPPIFPARSAAFSMRIDGMTLTVTDSVSGASWSVTRK